MTIRRAPVFRKSTLQEIDRAIDKARSRNDELKKKAADLEGDIVRLREGLVAAARLIQDHEVRIGDLNQQLDVLNRALQSKRETLNQRRKQMGIVLTALQRVAQYPPEALIARPITPGDTVRSAILLRAAIPELERRAVVLRDDLAALRETHDEAERRHLELDAAQTDLAQQRKLLQTLLGRKSRLRRRTVAKSQAAEQEMKSLAAEAQSLRELMTRLEAARDKRRKAASQAAKGNVLSAVITQGPPPGLSGKPIEDAFGNLPFPVVGKVIARYGQKSPSGLTHKGITLETRAGTQVIAPYEGRVAFSGPFRGYGQLLIIEHGEGYHTLLAGMTRLDGTVGQWFLAGEPVGIMGRNASDENGGKPTLYVELRRKGQPINPLPWLAVRSGKTEKDKVSG